MCPFLFPLIVFHLLLPRVTKVLSVFVFLVGAFDDEGCRCHVSCDDHETFEQFAHIRF